jgi:hypothetical protein
MTWVLSAALLLASQLAMPSVSVAAEVDTTVRSWMSHDGCFVNVTAEFTRTTASRQSVRAHVDNSCRVTIERTVASHESSTSGGRLAAPSRLHGYRSCQLDNLTYNVQYQLVQWLQTYLSWWYDGSVVTARTFDAAGGTSQMYSNGPIYFYFGSAPPVVYTWVRNTMTIYWFGAWDAEKENTINGYADGQRDGSYQHYGFVPRGGFVDATLWCTH